MAAPSFQDKFDDPPGQATLPGVEPSIGRNYAPPDEHFWFDPKEQVKPRWVPDEAVERCANCAVDFDFFFTRRHHCRLCGRVFCDSCSSYYCLLPEHFNCREPQRTCRPCNFKLRPMQPKLLASCNATRFNQLDEETPFTRYLNSPARFTLGGELRKAAFSMKNLIDGVGTAVDDDQAITRDLFDGCVAVLFITVAKIAVLGGLRFGSGLVLARAADGNGWSPPCAVALGGLTFGVQLGCQVTDMVVPLHDSDVIRHFSDSGTHALVGSEVSISLGPLGRSAEASLMASTQGGLNSAISYSHARGLYGGVTLDGAIVKVRDDVNRKFYGKDVEISDIFDGTIEKPTAGGPLYDKLDEYEMSITRVATGF